MTMALFCPPCKNVEHMKGKKQKPSRRAKSMAMLFARVSATNLRVWCLAQQMSKVMNKVCEQERNLNSQNQTISNYGKAVEAQSVALQSLSKLVDRVLNQKKNYDNHFKH